MSEPFSLAMEPVGAAERYERGVTLRKAGLFKLAMEELRQAAAYPAYALKAYAQIGLCHQSTGRYEEAISAFRRALTCSSASIRETVRILYVLAGPSNCVAALRRRWKSIDGSGGKIRAIVMWKTAFNS